MQSELVHLGRYPLLVIDEVGYIPFEPEAANLFFQLVSSRYERASPIVTSNKQFGRWGEVFGDDVVAAAMIDRLVHHAEVIGLKGQLPTQEPRPRPRPHSGLDNRRLTNKSTSRGSTFNRRKGVNFQPALTNAAHICCSIGCCSGRVRCWDFWRGDGVRTATLHGPDQLRR